MREKTWMAALVATVALAAGAAWALESQTETIVAGEAFSCTATLVPGASGDAGVQFRGPVREEDVKLSIGFGGGGDIEVDGDAVCPYDPTLTYDVETDWQLSDGEWYVTILILEDGVQVWGECHRHVPAGEPTEVVAEGDVVESLEVE